MKFITSISLLQLLLHLLAAFPLEEQQKERTKDKPKERTKIYQRDKRQFTINKEDTHRIDFDQPFTTHSVSAFSDFSCTEHIYHTVTGNYFTGRIILCADESAFTEDLRFYNITSDSEHYWIETDSKLYIVPRYYASIVKHEDSAFKSSRQGNTYCYTYNDRENILRSISSWNKFNQKGVGSKATFKSSSFNDYVPFNSTHDVRVDDYLSGIDAYRETVPKKYCVTILKADWSLIDVKFDLSGYLRSIKQFFITELHLLKAFIKKEFAYLLTSIFNFLYKHLEDLIEYIWEEIDLFNERFYLFEYLVLSFLITYRSGSIFATIFGLILTTWAFGVRR